jgi:hypothetical protein
MRVVSALRAAERSTKNRPTSRASCSLHGWRSTIDVRTKHARVVDAIAWQSNAAMAKNHASVTTKPSHANAKESDIKSHADGFSKGSSVEWTPHLSPDCRSTA